MLVFTPPKKKKNKKNKNKNKSSWFVVYKIIEGVQAHNDTADWLENNIE